MNNSCIGCKQAITEQKANDEATIKMAMERAKATNSEVALYRDEQGQLCVAPSGTGYPIIHIITPHMRPA